MTRQIRGIISSDFGHYEQQLGGIGYSTIKLYRHFPLCHRYTSRRTAKGLSIFLREQMESTGDLCPKTST